MAVSIRELFLIVRAQNQASNTLRGVSKDLQGLSRSGALAAKNASLADKAMQFQNARGVARGNTAAAQSQLATIDKQRNRLIDERNASLRAQSAIQQELMNVESRRDTRLASRARYERHLSQVQQTIATAPSHGLSSNQIRQAQLEMERWQSSIGRANADIERYNNNLKGLNKAYASASKFSMGHASAIDRANVAYDKAASNVAQMTMAERNLRAEQYLNNKALQASNKEMERHRLGFSSAGFQQATHAIGGMGRMLQYAGGIGVAALGFMGNAAAKLSSQVTLAATQVSNTVAGVGKESAKDMSAIIDQMTKFPAASEDMANGLYDIFSTLNVNGKQGRDILVQVNKAAVAGSLSVRDATAGVLSVMSNFKEFAQTGAGAAQVLNRSFAAVRFGRMTMAEFQKTLQTTAPAAKAANQTFDTLAGTMAFLTRSLGASKAATGFARLTEVLGGQQMTDGLAKFGVKLTDNNGKFLQMDKIIDILVKRFPYLTQGGQKALNFFKSIGNLQGTIQARRAFVTLVSNVQGYHNILGKTVGDQNEFNKSFSAMSQSLGVKWAVFLNSLKAAALTIGTYVIPVFADLAKPIQRLIHWFQSLDESQKRTIGKWIAYAAIGATLVGVFLSITAAVLGFVFILGTAEVGMAAFGTAALVFASIAALGILIYKNWDTVGPVFMYIAGAVKDVVTWFVGLNSSVLTATGIFVGLVLILTKTASAMIAFNLIAGSTFLGAAIIAVAALVAGLYLLNKALTTNSDAASLAKKAAKDFSNSMDDVAHATQGAANAQESLVQAKFRIEDAKKSVAQYEKELRKATPGSKAYRDAQSNLARAQADVASATKAVSDAQKDLNTQLKTAADSSKSALNDLVNATSDSMRALDDLNRLQQPARVPGAARGSGFSQARIDEITKAQAEANKSIQEGITKLPAFQEAYKQLLDLGVSPTNEKMTEIRHNMSLMIAAAAGMSKTTTAQFVRLNDILGRVAEPREIKYISNIDKDITPSVKEFMRITHEIPSQKVVNFLSNHKDVQLGVAAIIAETKKIPSEKQIKFLDNIKQSAMPAIARLIRRIHGIPSKAQINVVLKHENEIDKARKKVEKLRAEQAKLSTLQLIHPQASKIGLDQGHLQGEISKAQAKLDKLTRKHNTATVFLKSKPNDPTSWGNTLGSGIKSGIVAGTFGLEAELAAALTSQAKAAVNDTKANLGIKSPSTVTKKLIGLPIIQGIIEGIKEGGKTGLKDAMNSAVDNMLSVFQDKTSMFTDQMGELFSGGTFQQKIDWGESLNIGDLQKDLKTQIGTFEKFQHGIARLGKKHVPLALRQEIQALGPEHQAELTALLNATPKQLRQYVNLWKKSHKDINRSATRATRDQLKIWRSQGANVALGFMSGMESYQPKLTRFFRSIFLGLYNEVTKHHKSHSPSQLYMDEGINVMKGFQLGLIKQQRMAPALFNPSLAPVGGFGLQRPLLSKQATSGRPIEHHDHTHYHIPSDPPKDLMTKIRQEDFRRRKHRGQ